MKNLYEPYDKLMDNKATQREELIDLIVEALCEFAPSIYSRSICREDIENWLKKRGG